MSGERVVLIVSHDQILSQVSSVFSRSPRMESGYCFMAFNQNLMKDDGNMNPHERDFVQLTTKGRRQQVSKQKQHNHRTDIFIMFLQPALIYE
jgi:hypothetical protein